MERRAFLDQEPPPGYIAGIGRGATGFTTRSDIGNARLPPQTRLVDESDEESGKFSDANEDGLLVSASANKEDEEADKIYKEVDERLKKRAKRKIALVDDDDETREGNLSNLEKISNQFIDLKKELSTVTEEQWASLPEVGDLTKRNKRLRQIEKEEQRTYAAPDSLLSGISGSIDGSVDIGALNSERNKLLQSIIDTDFDIGESSLDSSAFLKELDTNRNSLPATEMARMKKLLKSYTDADPRNADGWIARARAEEEDKKFENAKKLIAQGCANCPKNEDVWLENVRLNKNDLKMAKIVIKEAVSINEKSLNLWLKAIELETDIYSRQRTLRKAIESIPTSERLWLDLIDSEEQSDDKLKIAKKAIELIPNDVNLWLKLIRLEPYDDAKKTINRARKATHNNIMIWLEACRLEAFNNSSAVEKLGKLIKKMAKDCEQTNEEWLSHAITFEKEGLTVLTTLIVESVLSSIDEDEISYSALVAESERYKDHIFVFKAILTFIVSKFPKKTAIWKSLIALHKNHFSRDDLYAMFEKIVATVPHTAMFWLMYSKEVWRSDNNIPKAIEILQRALVPLPQNVDVWLAMIKLQMASKNLGEVNQLFKTALETIENDRVHHKYITFVRMSEPASEALINTINNSLEKFPECYKLYLQKAQVYTELNRLAEARETLSIATKQLPSEISLWKALSDADLALKNEARARSDLDLAILKNPASDLLWVYKLELERILKNTSQLSILTNSALKKFPHSATIWEFNLRYVVKKQQRKVAYQDAFTATNNDCRVLLVVGVHFWNNGNIKKAMAWFRRALDADRDYGDCWAWLWNCYQKGEGTDEEKVRFLREYEVAEPRHGALWPQVTKKIENQDKEPFELLKLTGEQLLTLN